MLAEKVWQIENREMTAWYIVEDNVGGVDVFVCLLVSKVEPLMTPIQTTLLQRAGNFVYSPVGIAASHRAQTHTPNVWKSARDLA